jgi:hypothetical protein
MDGGDERGVQKVNVKERHHVEGLGIHGDIILEGGKVWIGFIWLRTGTSGGML